MFGGPQSPRSCLANLQPAHRDVDEEKRNGWKKHRILVVAENDPKLGWPEREMIKHLAEKLFGQQSRKRG